MAGQARRADPDVSCLMAVFDAAWSVVGRYAYALDEAERDQLRCDLALQIARLVASGIDDHCELVRRSVLRFMH